MSSDERRILMKVTFCGHKDVFDNGTIRKWLSDTVENLIQRGADLFYLGGYGGFDHLAASVVWELKQNYPKIQSVLVLPYLDRKVDAICYDGTTYPPQETVPHRFAILKRNEWMVRESDVLVAYVLYDWGGAAKTLEYANRRKKEIIRYSEMARSCPC